MKIIIKEIKFTIVFFIALMAIQQTVVAQNNNLLLSSPPPVNNENSHLKGSQNKPIIDTITQLEVPFINRSNQDYVFFRTAYSLSYNNEHKQANWVAYELTSNEIIRKVKRHNAFRPDEELLGNIALNFDYRGSGWDRGHLAPAGDMCWSWEAMHESFLYSNISPQAPSFNRGIWVRLEDLVRKWTEQNTKLIVITGPVLEDNLELLGENKITIPKYFYKVILDHTFPTYKAIGFVLPNKASDNELHTFAVTVDSIETITGIDFLHKLPDEIETRLESEYDLSDWKWDFRLDQNRRDQCHFYYSNGIRCTRTAIEHQQLCKSHLLEVKEKSNNLILKKSSNSKN